MSDTFSAIWQKHFAGGNSLTSVPLFSGLPFIKHSRLPLYTNMGSTHTKGITYNIDPSVSSGFRKKVFLVFDVPKLENIPLEGPVSLHRYTVKQYPGYALQLDGFKDFESYLSHAFKGKSRNKLRSYVKRLEASFNIRYEMFCGKILPETYDHLFQKLEALMTKRFEEKQEYNNNLDRREWNFYRELFYPMILNKQASLFVTYDNENPIGMMLNYMWGKKLVGAITVFDIYYAKFNLGTVNIMKQIEWCLENGISTLDFSKGEFEYKKRWCNISYDFEYHILFDASSAKSRSLATLLFAFYSFKNWLRERGINTLMHRMRYLFRKKARFEESEKTKDPISKFNSSKD
jgi:CelD/BcsL family acetyltransferase involved in cellulose biosynthesis